MPKRGGFSSPRPVRTNPPPATSPGKWRPPPSNPQWVPLRPSPKKS